MIAKNLDLIANRSHMTPSQLHAFLTKEQGDKLSLKDCEAIMQAHAPTETFRACHVSHRCMTVFGELVPVFSFGS